MSPPGVSFDFVAPFAPPRRHKERPRDPTCAGCRGAVACRVGLVRIIEPHNSRPIITLDIECQIDLIAMWVAPTGPGVEILEVNASPNGTGIDIAREAPAARVFVGRDGDGGERGQRMITDLLYIGEARDRPRDGDAEIVLGIVSRHGVAE